MFRAPVLLACAALCACTPGGEVALRGRAVGGLGSQCLDAVNAAGAGNEAVPDLQPEPVADPALDGQTHRFFKLSVLGAADHLPIAGATVTTDNDVTYTSDKNGVVAYYEPGLMGQTVFFFAERPGYELPQDGFGYRGHRLDVTEGGAGELLMNRVAGSTVPPSTVGDLETRLLAGNVPAPEECFGIRVVDQETKRGVPLATLQTGTETFVSDSQGFVAVCNPDDVGTSATFSVTSHGYQFAAGVVQLDLVAGQLHVLELTRQNLAERLYRSTGQGIYRDSVLLGLTAPTRDSLLNGHVMTQDSVQTAEVDGKLFWCWGTTTNNTYPLANFGAACARSDLPDQGGLDPRLGADTQYIADASGIPSQLASDIAPTSSPTWLSGMVNVPDAQGEAQVFSVFVKPNGDLSVNRRGLLHYDQAQEKFVDTGVDFPLDDFVAPTGQPAVVQHGNENYVYYGSPLRIPASAEAMTDVRKYEVWSALPAGGGKELERQSDGSLAYGFKAGALETTASILKSAGVSDDQALGDHFTDASSGTPFNVTGGAAQTFNDHRQRFLRLIGQLSGTTSYLGEIWYLEGDTPIGPWVYARKVVSHNDYSFTSPWFHPYFEQAGGRYVFFEGTYTASLAGNDVVPTPRYNHNQLLYRLDLDQPALALPVAVYDASQGKGRELLVKQHLPSDAPALAAAFFAQDQPSSGTVPVFWSGAECGARRLTAGGKPVTVPLFYAVAIDDPARAANLVPLFGFSSGTREFAYSVSKQDKLDGLPRQDTPVAYVWPSPIAVALPVSDYPSAVKADAGPDQCLIDTAAHDGASVTLHAAASKSTTGRPLSFEWRSFDEDCVLGTSETLSVHVSAGVHAFVLRATDDAGHTSDDDVVVEVGDAN